MKQWGCHLSKPDEGIHVDIFPPSTLWISLVKLVKAEGSASIHAITQKQVLHFLGVRG